MLIVALIGALTLVAAAPAIAGHTLGHYPSYYPDEIRVDSIDASTAAKRLVDKTLHAYIGTAADFSGPVPSYVRSVGSLERILILDFDPASPALASEAVRCRAARAILAVLSGIEAANFTYHPYPITPYHPDYLHHLDRVDAAKRKIASETGALPSLSIGARGRLAAAIVASRWPPAVEHGTDVTLQEIAVEDLAAADAAPFSGWIGSPWAKSGWFQAYRLLATAPNSVHRQAADEIYQRLMRGESPNLAAQADLERRLISMLTAGCRRLIAGFAVKREFVNEEFSSGIENISFDSQSGLNTPVFLRTAKLKDYPWNGRLLLGVNERPTAAWNPVAGFTDAPGRLIWAALGDSAMYQVPYNAGWAANRAKPTVRVTRGQSGGITVPEDALRPRPGGGTLERVGRGIFSSAKVAYEVLASPFLDGSETEIADLVYPFVFAYRWGADSAAGAMASDSTLAATFGAMRDRLVGLRSVRVDRSVFNIAEGLDIVRNSPVLEVYLMNVSGDDDQVAALAPPWSTVPWHLLALMEEAVNRRYAAFSQDTATRDKVPWLDLVRDASLRENLIALTKEFEQRRFRPTELKSMVSGEDAARRWRAIRAFAEAHGHFLVANGPYRLKSWEADSTLLAAVREATYPLGFGTFDHLVAPPRAVIREVTRQAGAITVRVDADITVKVGRGYEVRREPLTRSTAHGTRGVYVISRYLLIGPDGAVMRAGKMTWEADDSFKIEIPDRLLPGRYTALIGVFLDGNSLNPSLNAFSFMVDDKN